MPISPVEPRVIETQSSAIAECTKAFEHGDVAPHSTLAARRGSTLPLSYDVSLLWKKVRKVIKRVRPIFGRAEWTIQSDVRVGNASMREFCATGSDPQFKLPYRLRPGWYRAEIQLKLPIAFSEAKLYANFGDGYSEATAFSIHLQSETLEKRFIYLPRTATLRFDPMTGVGAFQIDHLCLKKISEQVAKRSIRRQLSGHTGLCREPLDNAKLEELWQVYNDDVSRRRVCTEPPSILIPPVKGEGNVDLTAQILKTATTACRACIKRLWPVFRLNDWIPRTDIRIVDLGTGQYEATGSDPQFGLPYRLGAGWYKLELQLTLPSSCSEAKVYPDFGEGYSEATAFSLPVITRTLTKRIIHLPKSAKLRFDPMTRVGSFKIDHLYMAKISEAFAIKRMQKKLAARHYCSRPQSRDVTQLWRDYNDVFEACAPGRAPISYSEWIEKVESRTIPSRPDQSVQRATWTWHPRFSIIMTTHYDTALPQLSACLNAVFAQSYPDWEVCIAQDVATASHVREMVLRHAEQDKRIKVRCCATEDRNVSRLNAALSLAGGDFVYVVHQSTVLAEHALYAVAEAVQQHSTAQLIYSDEDKLDLAGQRCEPFFKPDFSPDLLYSQNYLSHTTIYRRTLVDSVRGFQGDVEGGEEYDLVLRCLACITNTSQVLHIPQILSHTRMEPESTTNEDRSNTKVTEGECRALQAFFDNRSEDVTVSVVAPGLYRQHRPLPAPAPLVTLIVPTRDAYDIVHECINSIMQRTTYPRYEILVVDNQTSCLRTLSYLTELDEHNHVRVLRYNEPFNYSAINNFAARHAKGSVLGLINNDVEVITPEWLSEMVSHVMRPEIGCVGAKLYYPDDTLQHAGVVLGLGGVAGHSHKHFSRSAPGYFGRLRIVHNVSAVTGAALLIRKDLFEAVGGLDEKELSVAFNDVDLCLRVRNAGYRNLWTPFAELYHHESKTRGADQTTEKQARFKRECEVMQRRWGDHLYRDPYYSPHLTLSREDYSIGLHT